MKTLKNIINRIRFFINLKTRPNKAVDYSLELTNPRFGEDLNKNKTNKKEFNSLLSQMYSEDNSALFI